MPNSKNQRAVGASVPIERAELYAAHAKLLGLTTSRFVMRALDVFVATLPPLDNQPPPPVRPAPTGPNPTSYSDATHAEQKTIGLSALEVMYGEEWLPLYALRQLKWIRGHGVIRVKWLPRCRYPDDEQFVRWLEHHGIQIEDAQLVRNARRIREHIATLPT